MKPVPAPVRSPTTSDASFFLIFAPTNEVVITLQDGAVIDLDLYGLSEDKFNVQAVPALPNIDKVRFVENGRTEGVGPYAFCGDNSGSYNACDEFQANQGVTTVTVVLLDGQGDTVGTANVSFEIVKT